MSIYSVGKQKNSGKWIQCMTIIYLDKGRTPFMPIPNVDRGIIATYDENNNITNIIGQPKGYPPNVLMYEILPRWRGQTQERNERRYNG